MDPPPSRYRVVERKGRLEVVDTWAGRNPSPPRAPSAAPVQHFADLQIEEPVAASAPGVAPAAQPMPDFAPADPAWSVPAAPERYTPSGYAPARDGAAQPDLLRTIANTVCSDARDGNDRLVLTTAAFYDRKAPRNIPLDLDGERELGLVVLVLLAVSVSGVIFAVLVGWVGWIAIVAAVWLAGQAKTIATPWLDRLEARSR